MCDRQGEPSALARACPSRNAVAKFVSIWTARTGVPTKVSPLWLQHPYAVTLEPNS